MSSIRSDINAGHRLVTNTLSSGVYSISDFHAGRLLWMVQYDSTGTQIGATTNTYDAHGRLATSCDARNGTNSFAYDNADRQTSVTSPPAAVGQSAQVTTTAYNNMGWVTNVTLPDNTAVASAYLLTGQLGTNSGSRTYPVSYTYDYAGRLKTMTTWTNFASRQGAATTTWNYDAYRGFLTNKAYADGVGPRYSYTAGGRLKSRTWARNVTCTYVTNAAGDIVITFYSDNTPGVTNTFDRVGRPTAINHGTNITALVYNDANQILSEAFNGLIVTNVYDSKLRRTTNGLWNGSIWLAQFTNSYDSASRLSVMSDGTHSATYAYHPSSALVNTITFKESGTTRLTTTKSWDFLNRLTQISSVPSADSTISFAYAYNSANQRTTVTNADSSRRVFTYDALGQVTSGKKYWSDGTVVAGQQFEYGFDDIGNRRWTAGGGNEWGTDLRYENYTANNLNQYTLRTVPGRLDVLGSATNASIVSVNNQRAYRKSDYYREELLTDNSMGAVYPSITNVAVINNGTNADTVTNVTGNLFLPQTPEIFAYDADGNLTNDGRWMLSWDAENRLTALESSSNAPAASKLKLEFYYDYRNRRTSKVVNTWTGSNYIAQSTNRFFCDDWNLIAILGPSSSVLQSFMWGTDLSGTMRRAGGVGGLLALNDTTQGVHFVHYDGSGNASALVNAMNGTVSAEYEYGPSGELIRIDTQVAKANPIRFSSKYLDAESDLAYYGHRYYRPGAGRWLTRDPLEETGGHNLYAFVANNALSSIDYLGLDQFKVVGEKANQLQTAIASLKPGTSDDFKLPFMKAQLCILEKLAQGECCNSAEGARWLNDVIGKFMDNFLDALNGNYYTDNARWQVVLTRLPTPSPVTSSAGGTHIDPGSEVGTSVANWLNAMLVSREMALTHIQQDLRQALKLHGVRADDWDCIGKTVDGCQRNLFNWFERKLPTIIFPREYADIAYIRDQVRNSILPPAIPIINVKRNQPSVIVAAEWRYR